MRGDTFHGGQVSPLSCPLCTSTVANRIEIIAFDAIWSALEQQWGARFSDDVKARHSPGSETELRECAVCGLQYFNPALPGDPEFYRQLTTTSPLYYSGDKWDFQAAASLIGPSSRVLDVACGSGQFLDMARSRGAQVCGIDTNPAAAEAARGRGFPVHCIALDDFARDHRKQFTCVTAFQIVEHLSSVLPFVKAMLDCLEPGGVLVLTVPNRMRRLREALEPLDCPPHHMSRWTVAQFDPLARALGCRIAGVTHQPASMHECRAILRNWLAGTRSEALWARAIGRVCFSSSLYRLYASAGLLDRFGLYGMSILCALAKPR